MVSFGSVTSVVGTGSFVCQVPPSLRLSAASPYTMVTPPGSTKPQGFISDVWSGDTILVFDSDLLQEYDLVDTRRRETLVLLVLS